MNWFKQNPIAVALIVVAVIGTGATSYLAVDATARRDEAQANLDSQLQKLKQFQNQKPFPTENNLKAVQASLKEYRDEIAKYRTALAAMEEPLTPINPQEFQDDLRKAVDELRKKAIEKGVTLPDNFFYGFDEYQATPPSQQEVGELNREFRVIRQITDEIVDLKIGSIASLKRQEIQAPSPSPTPTPAAKPGATPAPKAPAISTKTFTITFTAPQEKLLTAFNMIQDADEFLLIRSLTMDNTSPQPPMRTQSGDPSSPALALPTPSASASAPETIQAVLGRESVIASLTIEILDFPDWESKPADESKTTPPPK
jgi:outer membrane protein OmpA-like peptidoglycan-associated protein